ncbi:hypothetical protein E0765_02960 [Sulfuricurvum sp. IAE1]|uniref:hypothetical protein n=1 Tax=Sulfuricurvum sp. IAE1 TaxID=2546102 RepID=UPI00105378FD|nr:hypothetical protein [Sulfuricurvum sp. IAE1]TDA68458.1 hypothetical protein E0765_02960 [Sulfuricurvum sp. IAE1]
MIDLILQSVKDQPAYVAIVATLILTIFKQTPSKLTFSSILGSYGIILFLIFIIILQTQGQLKQINQTNEMKLKIDHLEKILKDNNLTVTDQNIQVKYESKIKTIEELDKIKLLPIF